ncbi:hypothetical protein C8T65DRAFT_610798 [Cerioporus squamosus]|nr:hypothetical protein C8T65DRAFT_745215 [Cerioporus squamosus]KAI0705279.1 hypothetical protein C8T65DRAFT_610798 [Cerioporus squamosus]
MHHCLLIPEIYNRILDFVSVTLWGEMVIFVGYNQVYYSNPILAALARTCRAFLEPTLDVLWRNQLTLGPLVLTLPEDAYTVETLYDNMSKLAPDYDTIQHIVMKRPLVASDWTRFDYYARRIKNLGYYMVEFPDQDQANWANAAKQHCARPVNLQTMAYLALYRRGSPLLPNLTRLRWHHFDSHYSQYLPIFFGPNLTSLSIAFHREKFSHDPDLPPLKEVYDDLVPILERLDELCPSLTTFALHAEQDPDVIAAMLPLAYYIKRLEGFIVAQPPDVDAKKLILHLASLPSLKATDIAFNEEASSDLSFLSPLSYPFPSLENLHMRTQNMTSCKTLIKMMQTCRLRLVTFDVLGPSTAAELHDLLSALRTHCALDTLQFLIIDYPSTSPRPWPIRKETHTLTMKTLRPILDFPNMRTFWVTIPLYGSLNDQDLALIADSWPGIIFLRILAFWNWCAPSAVTLAGVAYVAWRCPLLITLSVAADLSSDNVAETTSRPGFKPNKHMRFWETLDSAFAPDPDRLARSVRMFAPLMFALSGEGWTDVDSNGFRDGAPAQDPFAYFENLSHNMRMLAEEELDRVPFGLGQELTWAEREAQEMNPWGAVTKWT